MGTAWLGLKAVALAWLALALACKILSQAVGTWPGLAPAWPWLGPWLGGGGMDCRHRYHFFVCSAKEIKILPHRR
ncbi:hypothetical protein JB92DRAFT_3041280 [Gautieria morchelliformis]|nr:hypothetical protein JB92DRAFT_3041280 [Gautieria morchelliformis]